MILTFIITYYRELCKRNVKGFQFFGYQIESWKTKNKEVEVVLLLCYNKSVKSTKYKKKGNLWNF